MDPTAPPRLFQPYLLPHEHILWTGQPKQGLILRPSDALLIPFSLFWAGFAFLWNVGVWGGLGEIPGEGAPLMFKLFGLPFLVIGFYFLIGRFVHDAAIRRNTAYALTDHRAIILRGLRFRKFTSLDLDRLPALELSERGDGSGSIGFEGSSPFASLYRYGGFGAWLPSLANPMQFFRIPNVRHVYQLIRDQAARR